MRAKKDWDDTLAEVSRWSDALAAARQNRDDFIQWAYGEGYSLREIADAADLSHAGVKKIIERA
jgi:hypothetical protein